MLANEISAAIRAVLGPDNGDVAQILAVAISPCVERAMARAVLTRDARLRSDLLERYHDAKLHKAMQKAFDDGEVMTFQTGDIKLKLPQVVRKSYQTSKHAYVSAGLARGVKLWRRPVVSARRRRYWNCRTSS